MFWPLVLTAREVWESGEGNTFKNHFHLESCGEIVESVMEVIRKDYSCAMSTAVTSHDPLEDISEVVPFIE